MKLCAYFGKLGLIIANSPFINFQLIIEVLIPSDHSAKGFEQYVLVSMFVKKACQSLTNGHKAIGEGYCREMVSFFVER